MDTVDWISICIVVPIIPRPSNASNRMRLWWNAPAGVIGLRLVLLTVAYVVSGWLGLQMPYGDSHITLIWLPTGIAVAALLRWGWAVWPGIAIGAILVNLVGGSPLLLACAIAVGNTLAPVLSAAWLKRASFQNGFNRQRDVVAFVLAAAGGMVVSATLGVLSLLLAAVLPQQAVLSSWMAWWMGDTVGVLLGAPLLLTLTRPSLPDLRRRIPVLLAYLAIAVLVVWLMLIRDATPFGPALPLVFLTLPLLTWAALRMGPTGSAAAVLCFAILAAWRTANGHSVLRQLDMHTNLLFLWSFLAAAALTNLLITALLAERRQVEKTLRASEQRLRTMVETEPECVKVIDRQGNLLEMNAAGLAMLEADSVQAAQTHGLFNFVELRDRPKFAALHQRVMQGERGTLVFRVRGLRGTLRWLETHAAPMRDADGSITMLLGITRDVTDRRRAEENLRIAASAFEAQVGIMVTDTNAVILRVNDHFTRDSGYSAAEAVGQSTRMLSSGRHDRAFYAAMWAELTQSGSWQGEIWDRRKNGEVYPKWMTITAVSGDDGALSHYVSTQMDITERKTAEDEIRHLAFYDPLTLLPNRRLLQDRLRLAVAGHTRSGRLGALLFIDLDNFKTLNDTLGHDKGDLLLQDVAKRLAAFVREGDTVARLGGDEFVIMLENLDVDATEAARLAETVGDKVLAVLGQPYQLAGHEHRSTSSVGITLLGGHDTSADDLLKQADLAMYQAKAAGRNALRFFDPAMQAEISRRAVLETELRQAVGAGQIIAHYQAQVDGASRITGAELLARWQHPVRGLVFPDEFIDLAEETGLIVPLGHAMLETACAQLAAWTTQAECQHLTLAVNVSTRQLRQSDFVPQLLTMLERTGANPGRLKLELTESLLLDNAEGYITKMVALRAHGVGFALDDFGTGYSSLSYLKRLPLDKLKIDRSFVMDVLTDTNDAAIVKTVIALAHGMGLSVIAEGVETEEQRQFLASHGCHAYQGYLFSRPVPLADFEQLLNAEHRVVF